MVSFGFVAVQFAVPFCGVVLLIGVIQALILAGLTLIFLTLAVIPHEVED